MNNTWYLRDLLQSTNKKIIIDSKSLSKIEYFLQTNYCNYSIGDYYDGDKVSLPLEDNCIFVILESFGDKMCSQDIYNFLIRSKHNILLVNGSDDLFHVAQFPWYNKCNHFAKNIRERIVILGDSVLSNNDINYYTIFGNPYGSDISTIETYKIKSTYKKDKDFLALFIARERRKWRYVLAEHIENSFDKKNNIIKIHKDAHFSFLKQNKKWIGRHATEHHSFIPWDLYDRVNFEIVAETCVVNFDYITEKTLKPILGEIPFLVCSSPTYYQHLKNIGFKTFHDYIDESFATQTNLDTKSKMIVEQAKYIIDNGSASFRVACADIIEHNKDHLYYLIGKNKQFLQDQFLSAFEYSLNM